MRFRRDHPSRPGNIWHMVDPMLAYHLLMLSPVPKAVVWIFTSSCGMLNLYHVGSVYTVSDVSQTANPGAVGSYWAIHGIPKITQYLSAIWLVTVRGCPREDAVYLHLPKL